LYTQEARRQIDVATEVQDCLRTLEGHVRTMVRYGEAAEKAEDNAQKDDLKQKSDEQRDAFYGWNDPDDRIEIQLRAAEQALRKELGPVLLLSPETRPLSTVCREMALQAADNLRRIVRKARGRLRRALDGWRGK
jgi:hypothetical protein